jgi:hypothetical protein
MGENKSFYFMIYKSSKDRLSPYAILVKHSNNFILGTSATNQKSLLNGNILFIFQLFMSNIVNKK